eukprot:m.34091 g.34091  ORF g.34091 m.34091 type:complete len:115 (+) comp43395_c0_seq1:623-967(+)
MSDEVATAQMEAKAAAKYGGLAPKGKPAHLAGKLNGGVGERKFFDSADNAMVAAGMQSAEGTGHVIATAQTVAVKKNQPARPSAMSRGQGASGPSRLGASSTAAAPPPAEADDE